MRLKNKMLIYAAILCILAVGSVMWISLYHYEYIQRQSYEEKVKTIAHYSELKFRDSITKFNKIDIKTVYIKEINSIYYDLSDFTGLSVALYDSNLSLLKGNSDWKVLEKNTILNNEMVYIRYNDGLDCYKALNFNGKLIGWLRFSYDITDVIESRDIFFYKMFQACSGILLIVLAFSFIVSCKLSKKIENVNAQAKAITSGDFLGIIEVKGKDEIADLEKSLINMSHRIENDINLLEEAKSSQKNFFCSVTHDLKTPLANIKAYSGAMMLYREDEELFERAGDVINRETIHLTEMIDEILDYAKNDCYDGEEQTRVDFDDIVTEQIEKLNDFAMSKNIRMNYNSSNIKTQGYRKKYGQILYNVLENAVKYNRENGIVDIEAKNLDEFQIRVTVKDTGIKILDEDKNRIFEAFSRGDQSRNREIEGHGLGLFVARELARRCGGDVKLLESCDDGNVFEIKLGFMV